MKLSPDTQWQDFRSDPNYTPILHSTAWTWIKIIQAFTSAPPRLANSPALSSTYYRATLALPQLPSEGTNNRNRFNNSRWRHSSITPNTSSPHCEHPWSKRITKDIVLNATSIALSHGAHPEDLILPIAAIIDSRQDTLLLPSQHITQHNVLPNSQGDGLAIRYAQLINDNTIIDRTTGNPITSTDATNIENKPTSALNSIAALLRVDTQTLLKHHKTTNLKPPTP